MNMGYVKAPDIPRPIRISSVPESRIQELMHGIIEFQSRASGRTTRIVDQVIQQLYRNPGEWVALYDHYYNGRSEKHIYNMVMRRMEFEHPNDVVERRQGKISSIEIRLASCPSREYFERKVKRLRLQLEAERDRVREDLVNKLKY